MHFFFSLCLSCSFKAQHLNPFYHAHTHTEHTRSSKGSVREHVSARDVYVGCVLPRAYVNDLLSPAPYAHTHTHTREHNCWRWQLALNADHTAHLKRERSSLAALLAPSPWQTPCLFRGLECGRFRFRKRIVALRKRYQIVCIKSYNAKKQESFGTLTADTYSRKGHNEDKHVSMCAVVGALQQKLCLSLCYTATDLVSVLFHTILFLYF